MIEYKVKVPHHLLKFALQAFATYDELTRSFKLMYDTIGETNAALRTIAPPKHCHITTMTFVATLSRQDLVMSPLVVRSICSYASDDTYFTTIAQSAFSASSIEFHSTLMPSVRIKAFNKGALQITGCKTHVQAMHSIVEVCRVLSMYFDTPLEAVTMDVALMNVNVSTHTGINLTKCAQAARFRGILAEQPERPPSCILKIPGVNGKMTTVLVYKPGKFTICAPSPEDAHVAYTAVMNIIDQHPDITEDRTVDAIRRGKGQYTWTELVRCGMPGVLHTHPVTTSPHVKGCVRCTLNGNYFSV
jgi:TATA-box binding protein (TBP) (component of TFIID and TFIIIB)